jgi:hypothetical protein
MPNSSAGRPGSDYVESLVVVFTRTVSSMFYLRGTVQVSCVPEG